MPKDIACVILAGGQGKRMRSTDRHKVCFPIAGTPAIVRTVGMFKSVGIEQFHIVVGAMAEQVIATVAETHGDVPFVYQPSPQGTGHAALCAMRVLDSAGFDGDVLITMGDKVVQPRVVQQLVERHRGDGAAMTLAALPKTPQTSAGRIVADAKGNVLGNVELADIEQARQKKRRLSLAGRSMTARQVEQRSDRVNASLYLFRAEVLRDALASLRSDNAQGELYLTDAIEYVVGRGLDVAVLDVEDPEDLMAYNTPEELLRIEEAIARREGSRRRITAGKPRLARNAFRPAGQWIKLLEDFPPRLRKRLESMYGPDGEVIRRRRRVYLDVLKLFAKKHDPDRRVILVRAPGRINLMGRHVDHRGGFVNTMAINREVVVAASPRDDDEVTLANVRPKDFPARSFHVGELLGSANWVDWMDYLNSTTVRQVLEAWRGDWSNYAKAAVLRLQHACPDDRLRGMDCAVAGDIPMGAGLSSSSAIVVAMAECASALNGLDIKPQEFVDLCGEGEWFVGSRGGSSDHAAIRSGRRGGVCRVGFFPFRIEGTVSLPDSIRLVIANSHVRAAKSEGARDTFNHRVAAYNLAEMVFRNNVAILRTLEHLRDVDPDRLGVHPAEIYRAISQLPASLTRRGAMRLLPDHKQRLEELFDTHDDIGPYRLRDVAMFGIGECRRSDRYAEVLQAGDIDEIGRMMATSHDGDRVVSHRGGWASKYAPSYSNAVLDRLMREVAGKDPQRAADAQLHRQPGRYACSTPEIDYLVDLACTQQGVIGAQLAGAGLGGCTMILVRDNALPTLLSTLKQNYYAPRDLKPDLHVCTPVTGSGLIQA